MPDRFTRGGEHFHRHKGIRIGTLWSMRGDIGGDVTLSLDFDNKSKIAKIELLGDFIEMLNYELDLLLEEEYGVKK
jgi:hypothetical protein